MLPLDMIKMEILFSNVKCLPTAMDNGCVKQMLWLNLAELQGDMCCQQKSLTAAINIWSLYITQRRRPSLFLPQTNVANPSDEWYLTPK